jgi:hypothetical protein
MSDSGASGNPLREAMEAEMERIERRWEARRPVPWAMRLWRWVRAR